MVVLVISEENRFKSCMSRSAHPMSNSRREEDICFGPREPREERNVEGLVKFGFFLIILGAVYLATPNIIQEIGAFFKDFQLVKVSEPNISFPAPSSNHPVVYGAVELFCYGFGLFHIALLIALILYRSSVKKTGETLSGIVFWLGAGYSAGLLKAQVLGWFSYIACLIILAGVSLIITSLAAYLSSTRRR